MQEIGNSATGAVYAVVHTLVFVAIYVGGSIWLMAAIDPRLVVPMLVWLALYLALMTYVVPRLRRGAEQFQAAGAALAGRLVDTYSNIDVVKLFASEREEDGEGRAQFDAARQGFFAGPEARSPR